MYITYERATRPTQIGGRIALPRSSFSNCTASPGTRLPLPLRTLLFNSNGDSPSMTTFLFLHGSFHAAWNWHKVIPLLASRGHAAVALDLPGHGRDRVPAARVTLASCVARVLDAVASIEGDVVLVAHSRNGIVISQAAEREPERVRGLVYLAAYLVPDGKSMMDYAILDRESLVVRNVEPAFDERLVRRLLWLTRSRFVRWLLARVLPRSLQVHALLPAAYTEALYHDCPVEVSGACERAPRAGAELGGLHPAEAHARPIRAGAEGVR